ncbi:MAG: PilT/PilU family type 4a pilus ATPase [Deltaproteobacteria bacterium]|nr:PilT/PilU family type 4a pilus ATPase [Deltaproteobacteria bacterium]
MTSEHGTTLSLTPDEKIALSTGGLTQQTHALLAFLARRRGQDLHLSAGAPPSLRLDGELVRLPLPPLTPENMQQLMSELLNDEQKRAFVDNLELDFAISMPELGRFRCNLYRQRGSLSFTARFLRDVVPSAEELRLPAFLHTFALKPQGLVLITGPNGHGKSTTLAWMIDTINRERNANIVTIEDPIEYHFHHRRSNVNQREVGADTRSFAEGLRHVVRQNPDVIVIGELRDHESIATALTAAETGHLVLGTMHALNATAAVDRILDFFTGDMQAQVRAQLAEALQLVFAQRLLKRVDGNGRALAWESMSQSLRVRNAVREGRTHILRGLMQANQDDLVPMEKSLADLVAGGVVARDEALRYASAPDYLDDLVKVRKERGHR